jgi:hypothetical protein
MHWTMGRHNVCYLIFINNIYLIFIRCPICRYTQTPELVPDQKCFGLISIHVLFIIKITDCGRTSDLWMCLICGNIGCGRYAEAHAYKSVNKLENNNLYRGII